MLKNHRETTHVQLYLLILGKKGRVLGPKITRSADADCSVNPSALLRGWFGMLATTRQIVLSQPARSLDDLARDPARLRRH
jgi:hypothetical protein